MGWRGALDASVGFLRASIRRSVEVKSNALLLLALNKRLARMEEVLQPTPRTRPADLSHLGNSNAEGFQLGAMRPDKCAELYQTFNPTALNSITVGLLRCSQVLAVVRLLAKLSQPNGLLGAAGVKNCTPCALNPGRSTATWMVAGSRRCC